MKPPHTSRPIKAEHENPDPLASGTAETVGPAQQPFAEGLHDLADELTILIDWRDELAWRIAKARLQIVWMEKSEFDALVHDVRNWRAAFDAIALLAASKSDR
jgi:hypothetical protein